MSDLQCPARFILLSALATDAARALRGERVAAVYAGPPVDTPVAAVAAELGVPVHAVPRSIRLAEVVARDHATLRALEGLADLHRGETVVVVAAGRPGARVDVALDGDGVTVMEVTAGSGGPG